MTISTLTDLHARRRVLFSPSPPPPRDYAIPPVPPIPDVPNRHSRPRAALNDFAGVSLPMDRPHPLEAALVVDPARAQTANQQQNVAAPVREPPRQSNNMRLGGALLALNRRNEWGLAYPRLPDHSQDGFGYFPGITAGFNAIRRFLGVERLGQEAQNQLDPNLQEALQLMEEERNDMQQFRLNGQPPDRLLPANERYAQRQALDKEQADYSSIFTHPFKPESGFSNDFAVQDSIAFPSDAGSSSSASNEGNTTVLACAKCSDPLVTNVVGPEDAIRKAKLWALRCGHILDGKCIEQIMKPAPPPVSQDQPSPSSLVLRKLEEDNAMDFGGDHAPSSNKGKQKANPVDGMEVPSVPTDRKGKGRAYPSIPLSTAGPSWTRMGVAVPSSTPEHAPDTIRSRLRPRHSASAYTDDHAAVASQSNESGSQAAALPPHYESPTTRRRARGKNPRARPSTRGKGTRKGKGKPKPPVIEAEHIWYCPVPTCRHQHKSHLIDGQWKMAEDEGAIAMYV